MHSLAATRVRARCRTVTGMMNGTPEKLEVQLTSDALAFYVGQDVLLRRLIAQENAKEVSSLVFINRLRHEREKVRELISDIGVDALIAHGIDRDKLLRAEIRVVNEAEGSVVIYGIAHLSTRRS